MASSDAAWGIEIGAFAIKAIRLERDGDRALVTDFAVIPHRKVLSTPDLDQNEMIRLGLGQFISQKAVENETLVFSVPGHSAFARFAKLPPVEMKKVPDIVKFEAVQQIPFPIEEVEWDYQTFQQEDSPEIEVGIFAITRERVQQRLALYEELGLSPEAVTLSPVSVYNAMAYDHELEKREMAVIYLDIGTQATDVVVANQGQCWIRTFPLGGTHFTEAIANAFKLSYSKAEKLKLDAASSKYAKQIMQAMRPVFTDLLQDIQRSLGYYESVHRDVELKTMVGLGSTFKIPGLRKFLGQQLQMDVVRLDEYRKIRVEGREAASFSENAVNMATAYGLALQGVELAKIDANLVPVSVLRDNLWHGKIKWFAAAAALAIAGGAVTFLKPMGEKSALTGNPPAVVDQTIQRGKKVANEFQAAVAEHNKIGYTAENIRRLLDFRTVWPYLVNDVSSALASTNPQPELLGEDLDAINAVAPKDRRLVELLHLDGDYVLSGDKRQIDVTMRVLLTHEQPIPFLNQTVRQWLRDNAEPTGARADVPYRIIVDGNPGIDLNSDTMIVAETPDAEEEVIARGSSRDERRRNRDNNSSGDTGGSGGSMGGGGTGLGGGTPLQDDRRRRPPRGRGGGLIPGGGGGGGGLSGPTDPEGGGLRPGGGGGSGGGMNPGGGRRDRDRDDDSTLPLQGGEEREAEREVNLQELNDMAPTPDRPRVLPPNTQYYELEITFTVEILDPTVDNAADRTAESDSSNSAKETQS